MHQTAWFHENVNLIDDFAAIHVELEAAELHYLWLNIKTSHMVFDKARSFGVQSKNDHALFFLVFHASLLCSDLVNHSN